MAEAFSGRQGGTGESQEQQQQQPQQQQQQTQQQSSDSGEPQISDQMFAHLVQVGAGIYMFTHKVVCVYYQPKIMYDLIFLLVENMQYDCMNSWMYCGEFIMKERYKYNIVPNYLVKRLITD